MTDKMRNDAKKVLEDVYKTQSGTNLHSAVWFSVSPDFGFDYDYALFNHFVEAKIWLNDKYEAKKNFCSELYLYINGRVYNEIY